MAMASAKALREAACVMLAVGPYRYLNRQLLRAEAETLRLPVCMTVDKEQTNEDECELLFVKRSAKTTFMANTHVFPGGVLDKADHSSKWLELFQDAGHGEGHGTPKLDLFSSLCPDSHPRLPMYQTLQSSSIPGEVAFRICAIRELFEESGVLLTRRRKDVQLVAHLLPGSFQPAIKWLPCDTLNHWRTKIHNDAFQFIEFCKEFQCLPDVWSLVEWSNWLTPMNYHRRYDTVFYLCCPAQKPPISPDTTEVSEAKWLSPSRALEDHASSKLTLTPPQFMETYLLDRLGPLPSIHAYGLSRSFGRQSSLRSRNSVRILSNDSCIISISEDDDLYPVEYKQFTSSSSSNDPDFPVGSRHHCQGDTLRDTVTLVTSSNHQYEYECPSHTADELRKISVTMNRVEWKSFNDMQPSSSTIGTVLTEHMDKYATYCSQQIHSKL